MFGGVNLFSSSAADAHLGGRDRYLLWLEREGPAEGHADALQWLEYAPEDEDVQDHGHALGEWLWGMICTVGG